MSFPRKPSRDFCLEPLSDRSSQRSPHLGEVAIVRSIEAGASATAESQAAYEALNNAVFTAPGAAEWLLGLRLAVTAMIARMDAARRLRMKT
jgi:hypothetical protein